MKSVYKTGLMTAGIYATLLLFGALLNVISPSGMCAPGLGALFFLSVIPFTALVLFIRDSYCIVQGAKEYWISVLIHLLFFSAVFFGL